MQWTGRRHYTSVSRLCPDQNRQHDFSVVKDFHWEMILTFKTRDSRVTVNRKIFTKFVSVQAILCTSVLDFVSANSKP